MTQPTTPPPKKKSRRRWLIGAVIVAIALMLLVLAAPTILSTRPFVSMALSTADKHVNGRIELSSLSLGWFTGVKADGLKLIDPDGVTLLSVDHAAVPLPLWRAVVGNYAIGNAVIDGVKFDVRTDDHGVSNAQRFLASKTPPPSPTTNTPQPLATSPKAETKIPHVVGSLTLSHCSGTITTAGKPVVNVPDVSAAVGLPADGPITDSLKITTAVGSAPATTFSVDGTAAVLKNDKLALDTADVHQKITGTDIDFSAALPWLAKINRCDGRGTLTANLDITAGKTLAAAVHFDTTAPVAVSGDALKGDIYSTKSIQFAIPKLTGEFPDTLQNFATGHIKLDGGLFKIDQGQTTFTADLGIGAVLNLLHGQQPGSAGQLVVESSYDVPPLRAQIPDVLHVSPDVAVTSGRLIQSLVVTTRPEQGVIAIAAGVKDLTATKAGRSIAAARSLMLGVNETLTPSKDGGAVAITTVALTDSDKMLDVHTSPAGFVLTRSANGGVGGPGGDVVAAADLGRAAAWWHDFSGGPAKIRSGLGSLTVHGGPAGDKLRVDVNGIVQQLVLATAGNTTQPQTATIETSAESDSKAATIAVPKALIRSPFAVVTATDVLLSTASKIPMTDRIRSAAVVIETGDVGKLMALKESLSPATVTAPADRGRGNPAPTADADMPPVYDGGTATLKLVATHPAARLQTDLSLKTSDIPFHRGKTRGKLPASTLDLSASAAGTVDDAITSLDISKLSGNLIGVAVSMPQPIAVTLAPAMTATGKVRLDGQLAELSPVLGAVQGKPAYAYVGKLSLGETFGVNGKTITLDGGGGVENFQVAGSTFTEPKLAVATKLSMDDENINLTDVSAVATTTGAFNLSLTGTVAHLSTTRDLNLRAAYKGDWAKAWPALQPLLGEQFKTAKNVAGVFDRATTVTGSYPANVPSTQAIKSLAIEGSIVLDTFSWQGASLEKPLDLHWSIHHGTLLTVDGTRKEGENAPPPAVVNGGLVRLDHLAVDLTQSPPRLSTPDNFKLIDGLTVNPLFADSFLAKYLNNPLFVGAKEATGLLYLTIVHCRDLPLGDLVTKPDPANTGKADFLVSMTNLHLGVDNDQIKKALGGSAFEFNVKDATFSVADGVETQNMAFTTTEYSLVFAGKVRLADRVLTPMTVKFPLAVVARKTHLTQDKSVLDLLPETIDVPAEGPVNHPNFRLDQVIGKAVTDAAAKAVTNKLLGGDKSNGDPLGGLLDKIGGNKKKK